jgi:hypothetical protein
MMETIVGIWQFITSSIELANSMIIKNVGGILLVIATIAAVAAYYRFKKIQENQQAMEKLADAIIKGYNKEMRENR